MPPDLSARRAAACRSMRQAVSLAIGVIGTAWWDGWLPWYGQGHYDWLVQPTDAIAYLAIEAFFLVLAAYGSRLAALAMLLGGGGPLLVFGAAIDGWLAWGDSVPTRCSVLNQTMGVDRATGLVSDSPLFAVDLVGAVPRQMGWCETSGRFTRLAVALRGRPPHAPRLPTPEDLARLRASGVPTVDSASWRALFPGVALQDEIRRRIGSPPAPIPYAWARAEDGRVALFWPDHAWVGGPDSYSYGLETRDGGETWTVESPPW